MIDRSVESNVVVFAKESVRRMTSLVYQFWLFMDNPKMI